jgi:hypothetical protein
VCERSANETSCDLTIRDSTINFYRQLTDTNMAFFADSISRIKQLPTLAITDLARTLRAEGKSIITLSHPEHGSCVSENVYFGPGSTARHRRFRRFVFVENSAYSWNYSALRNERMMVTACSGCSSMIQ